jgi:hypothetical protein
MKRQIPGAPTNVGLSTNDIPPFPLHPTDTLTCRMVLENNQGSECQRYPICEAALSGTELQTAIENAKPGSVKCTVSTETGDWEFEQLAKTAEWVLRSVVLFAPVALLKELIKDL